MGKNEELLSIGEFSKLTGVHVKSLRYYEQVGVLIPAFIDPDSGYRYYDRYQREIVDSIQFCVKMDIPLREFKRFTEYKDGEFTIHYDQLLDEGGRQIQNKLNWYRDYWNFMQGRRQEIDRAKHVRNSNAPLWFECPELICWMTPFTGKWDDKEFHECQEEASAYICKNGLYASGRYGLFCRKEQGVWKKYYVCGVLNIQNTLQNHADLMYIPAQYCLCYKIPRPDLTLIGELFPTYLSPEDLDSFVMSNLFEGNYNPSDPPLYFRCYVRS